MSQLMPAGLYTRTDLVSEISRFTPRDNRNCSFKTVVKSYLQRTRPNYETNCLRTRGSQTEKNDQVSVEEVCLNCNAYSEAMGKILRFLRRRTCIVAVNRENSTNCDDVKYTKRSFSLIVISVLVLVVETVQDNQWC